MRKQDDEYTYPLNKVGKKGSNSTRTRGKIGIRGGTITNDEIRKEVRAWDTKMWKQEMQEKATLKM